MLLSNLNNMNNSASEGSMLFKIQVGRPDIHSSMEDLSVRVRTFLQPKMMQSEDIAQSESSSINFLCLG